MYLLLESRINSGRCLRAKGIEERTSDAKTLEDNFRVFVLNGFFEEHSNLRSGIREGGLRLLI